MERSQASQDLDRALESVFNAVPKGKRYKLDRSMRYIEALARCGVDEYTRRCNQSENDDE